MTADTRMIEAKQVDVGPAIFRPARCGDIWNNKQAQRELGDP